MKAARIPSPKLQAERDLKSERTREPIVLSEKKLKDRSKARLALIHHQKSKGRWNEK
jgi:hypothetical protein